MAKERRKSHKTERLAIYILLFVVLVLIILVLVQSAFINYRSFRGHQMYIRNATDMTIQPWMTPLSVMRHYNISESILLHEFNVTRDGNTMRVPLEQICRKQKLNCSLLIEQLNAMVK